MVLSKITKFTGKLSHSELLSISAEAKALLVNTVKDNDMVSIVESIAVGTPIITTDVPVNSTYIRKYMLGIVKKQLDENDLWEMVLNSAGYVNNCMHYGYRLFTKRRAEQFVEVSLHMKEE